MSSLSAACPSASSASVSYTTCVRLSPMYRNGSNRAGRCINWDRSQRCFGRSRRSSVGLVRGASSVGVDSGGPGLPGERIRVTASGGAERALARVVSSVSAGAAAPRPSDQLQRDIVEWPRTIRRLAKTSIDASRCQTAAEANACGGETLRRQRPRRDGTPFRLGYRNGCVEKTIDARRARHANAPQHGGGRAGRSGLRRTRRCGAPLRPAPRVSCGMHRSVAWVGRVPTGPAPVRRWISAKPSSRGVA
jgi:hypothetical protein